MCTVTIVPTDSSAANLSFDVLMNRDERRTRSPADSPRIYTCGRLAAVMPTDPDSGGTWIAANATGLAAMLLNVNVPTLPPPPSGEAGGEQPNPPIARIKQTKSRGLIIPPLMAAADLAATVHLAADLDPAVYSPFRLILTDGAVVRDFYSDGDHLDVRPPIALDRPVMFTSSGVGDALVQPPRDKLFAEMFDAPPDRWVQIQREFHLHHWLDRGPLSVCMSRPDASTVSITGITIAPDRIVMRYTAVTDQQPAARTFTVALRGRAA